MARFALACFVLGFLFSEGRSWNISGWLQQNLYSDGACSDPTELVARQYGLCVPVEAAINVAPKSQPFGSGFFVVQEYDSKTLVLKITKFLDESCTTKMSSDSTSENPFYQKLPAVLNQCQMVPAGAIKSVSSMRVSMEVSTRAPVVYYPAVGRAWFNLDSPSCDNYASLIAIDVTPASHSCLIGAGGDGFSYTVGCDAEDMPLLFQYSSSPDGDCAGTATSVNPTSSSIPDAIKVKYESITVGTCVLSVDDKVYIKSFTCAYPGPTAAPTPIPTRPTARPTRKPTRAPSSKPAPKPTRAPSNMAANPTRAPTTMAPSIMAPTTATVPAANPTRAPSIMAANPTRAPTTMAPSIMAPTTASVPAANPTRAPTIKALPTIVKVPSPAPTMAPTSGTDTVLSSNANASSSASSALGSGALAAIVIGGLLALGIAGYYGFKMSAAKKEDFQGWDAYSNKQNGERGLARHDENALGGQPQFGQTGGDSSPVDIIPSASAPSAPGAVSGTMISPNRLNPAAPTPTVAPRGYAYEM